MSKTKLERIKEIKKKRKGYKRRCREIFEEVNSIDLDLYDDIRSDLTVNIRKKIGGTKQKTVNVIFEKFRYPGEIEYEGDGSLAIRVIQDKSRKKLGMLSHWIPRVPKTNANCIWFKDEEICRFEGLTGIQSPDEEGDLIFSYGYNVTIDLLEKTELFKSTGKRIFFHNDIFHELEVLW